MIPRAWLWWHTVRLKFIKIFVVEIGNLFYIQNNTYFYVKFYKQSEHVAKSIFNYTYSSTYTHIYIYKPK